MSLPKVDQLIDALRPVQDPELHRSIVDLGMVRDVQIQSSGDVSLTVVLTIAGCPLRNEIQTRVNTALRALDGVKNVALNFGVMNDEERAKVRELVHGNPAATAGSSPAQGHSEGRKISFAQPGSKTRPILISSGKGGVGKSTTAVNLALALAAEGASVGLLDADIYGPSQPMMMGIEGRPESEDGKTMEPMENYGVQVMSIGFLVNQDEAMIWRGPMATQALEQLLRQTNWKDLDYLIIDMPPGTGDIQLTLSQRVPMTGAVIVTTPQDIALLDAKKGIKMFEKVGVPILGIVENMAVHVCTNCGHIEHIFGADGGKKMAENYQMDYLGALPLNMQIRLQADNGKPTVVADPDGEVAGIYKSVARQVAIKIAAKAKDFSAKFPTITVSKNT